MAQTLIGDIHYAACRIEQIINHLAETDGGKGVHQQSTDNAQNGNTNTAAAQFHQEATTAMIAITTIIGSLVTRVCQR